MYCSPLLCPWDFLGKNTGVDCHSLLLWIFLTLGLNPSLLHCRQILYHLSHLGSCSVKELIISSVSSLIFFSFTPHIQTYITLWLLLWNASNIFLSFTFRLSVLHIWMTASITAFSCLHKLCQGLSPNFQALPYPSQNFIPWSVMWASQAALVIKHLPANRADVRDAGSIPGLGRSPEEGNGYPLQYSCLENLMDGTLWRAPVHRVSKSQTEWLSTWFTITFT